MVVLLRTAEGAALYPRFQDRVSRLARIASGIGWGYSDHVDAEFAMLCRKLAAALARRKRQGSRHHLG